jgi:hypothetical protein
MVSGLALAVYALLLVPGAVLVWRKPVAALYAWIVGLAAHNAVMAALYGAGVRGSSLTAIQAWKEILLGVALARVAVDAARSRRLPFRINAVDVLALAFGALICVYAVLPQSWLGGTADHSAIGLALKHDLVPVGAYFLGRSLIVRREELVRVAWTLLFSATAVAVIGLLDDFLSRSPGGDRRPWSTTSTSSSATTTRARVAYPRTSSTTPAPRRTSSAVSSRSSWARSPPATCSSWRC